MTYSDRQICALSEHTNLDPNATFSALKLLSQQARDKKAVGVCILPDKVKDMAIIRRDISGLFRIVTVANFPGQPILQGDALRNYTQNLLEKGAQDIDLVFDYNAFLKGDFDKAAADIRACRQAIDQVPEAKLKVILETGAFYDDDNELLEDHLKRAAQLVIEKRVDFLKTCTEYYPKRPAAAFDEVVILALAIKESCETIGLNISGGVSDFDKALAHLKSVERVLGKEFIKPSTMRFGASKLLAPKHSPNTQY